MRAVDFFKTPEGKKYLAEFQDEIFVIKYGGAALETGSMKRFFLEDVAQMQKHGLRIILVHGGGKMLSAKMKEENIEVEFVNGIRKTTERIAELALEVFTLINIEICEILKEFGINPLSLSEGKTVGAKLIDSENPDNRVGDAVKIDTGRVDISSLPVLSSIGRSVGPPVDTLEEGSLLNINADMLALSTALAIKARKLIFISDVNGIYLDHEDKDTKLSRITESEINNLVEKGVLHGGMRLKVEMALRALKNGVRKVHFLDGRIEHSIMKEIFTDEGIGTEIVHDE
ncbi:MAG: acetylglutamate kinase [Leptospirales bacterium]